MRKLYLLMAAMPVCFAGSLASGAWMTGLGPADGYSIFTLGDLSRSNSDIYGRIAAGGNVTLSSYSVGSRLSGGDTKPSLVVGGALNMTYGNTNGAVVVGGGAVLNGPTLNSTLDVGGDVTHSGWGSFSGTVTVGGNWNSSSGLTIQSAARIGGTMTVSGSTNISGGLDVGGNKASINNPTISGGLRVNGQIDITGGGSISPGVTYQSNYNGPNYISATKSSNKPASVPAAASVPVDFGAATAFFKQASQQWSQLNNNGTNTLAWGNRTLTGTDSKLNVFNISASDLAGIYSLAINVPAGSTVLVNVLGTSVTIPNVGYTLNGAALGSEGSGASYGSLLWNFPQATSLTYSSFGGTILAPLADVTFNSAQHNGMLIALSSSGNGETHEYAFTGSLPSVSVGSQVPEPYSLGLLTPVMAAGLRRRR